MAASLKRLAAEHRAPLLALAAGLVLGLSVYGYLSSVVRVTPVLLAATDLQPGARLDRPAFRLAYLPRAAVHPDALTSPGQALGRVTRVPLVAGEQILDPKLSGGKERGGPGPLLQPGERAFFLSLGAETRYPPDLVRPGERVDLIFVSDGRPDSPSQSRLLLSGVRVLSAVRERGGVFDRDEAVVGLALAVTVPQAERLAYALAHGRVHVLPAGPDAGEGAAGSRAATTGDPFPSGPDGREGAAGSAAGPAAAPGAPLPVNPTAPRGLGPLPAGEGGGARGRP